MALATLCLMPAVSTGDRAIASAYNTKRSRSPAVIVAVSELRAITTRSVALAAIAALAVYGSVAIGGARDDLLRGIDNAIAQYHATADIWVTNGSNVFNTDSFALGRHPRQGGPRTRGAGRCSIYQGTLIDVGPRRLWVRARPPSDPAMLESSQILSGSFAHADALIRDGGWAAVSNGFAERTPSSVWEHSFELPTPSGAERLRVGGHHHQLRLATGNHHHEQRRLRSRLEDEPTQPHSRLSCEPGVTEAAGMRSIYAAIGSRSGLSVRSASQRGKPKPRQAPAKDSTRSSQIWTLLLVAAALAVAAALSATIWQRRARLASLKIQGYHPVQLWSGLLLESGVMLGVGSLTGAIVGIYGHALAGRWLTTTTGFPAPFSIGAPQVLLTLGLDHLHRAGRPCPARLSSGPSLRPSEPAGVAQPVRRARVRNPIPVVRVIHKRRILASPPISSARQGATGWRSSRAWPWRCSP